MNVARSFFAIVALAAGCEKPAHSPPAPHAAPDPWAARTVFKADVAIAGVAALIDTVTPRMMPSGAPACGNEVTASYTFVYLTQYIFSKPSLTLTAQSCYPAYPPG